MGRWWSARSTWQQALLIVVPGVGAGVGIGMLVRRAQQRRVAPGYTPYAGPLELPGLLGLDTDEVDDDPPPDIEYDNFDAPCITTAGPVPFESADDDVGGFCTPPADLEPIAKTNAAYAVGADRPRWPLRTDAQRKLQVSYQDKRGKWHGRWGRHFGASRSNKSGDKHVHAGVDLFADPGDEVVATEPGEIIATLPFHRGTWAMYLKTDDGLIINYGELQPRSWHNYGIESGINTGQRVNAGDRLAKVGLSNDGSHMLHLEAYEPTVTIDQIRQGQMQWPKGDPVPDGLLDPTEYLVRAQRVRYEQLVDQA